MVKVIFALLNMIVPLVAEVPLCPSIDIVTPVFAPVPVLVKINLVDAEPFAPAEDVIELFRLI